MPFRINNNIPGLNALRILNITGRDLNKRIERLSSGLKVNRAADDAAGLSVSEGLRAEISGFAQGIRNSEQAINLVQTAEGALNEINGLLLRMRELSVQSASATVNDDNRVSVNAEFTQLVSEIDRIAQVTSYNNSTLLTGFGNVVSQDLTASSALDSATTGVIGVQVSGAAAGTYVFADAPATNDREITLGNGVTTQTLNVGPALDADGGTLAGVVATSSSILANFDRLGIQLTLSGFKAAEGNDPQINGYRDGLLNGDTLEIGSGTGGTFQVGPDDGAVHRLEVNVADMRASGSVLNLGSLSVGSLASAQAAISPIDLAIEQVTQARGDLGSIQSRLTFGMQATGVMMENDISSDSTIRDANIAEEVSAFSRAQILTQSGLAMFAQANIVAASVLSLL